MYTDRKVVVALIMLAVSLAACGMPEMASLPSLAAKQPKVIEVSPKANESVASDASVSVVFSVPVEPASINKYSFLIVKDMQDTAPLLVSADIEDGKLSGIEGEYSIDEAGSTATFKPLGGFETAASYGIVVSTAVYTPEHFPFNQTPGSEATPFISSFSVSADGLITPDTSTSDEGPGAGSIAVPPDDALPEAIINEVFYDAVGSDTAGILFVELKGNEGDKIGGYRIIFINGDDGKITDSVTLPSNAVIGVSGLYVVADALDGKTNQTSVANANFISDFDPHNGPDAVQLLNSRNELLDAVCYGEVKFNEAENKLPMCEGSFGPDAPSGQSVTRDADGSDSGDNQIDITINPAPSPGA